MSSVGLPKRIAAMAVELQALLGESVDGSAGQRTAAAYEWETFVRRCVAMTHRMTTAVTEIPVDELGEPNRVRALSTLLRISAGKRDPHLINAMRARRARSAYLADSETYLPGRRIWPHGDYGSTP